MGMISLALPCLALLCAELNLAFGWDGMGWEHAIFFFACVGVDETRRAPFILQHDEHFTRSHRLTVRLGG